MFFLCCKAGGRASPASVTDAGLDWLHQVPVWQQVQRVAWRLPQDYLSAQLLFPSAREGFPEGHPIVIMVQVLTKHIEQLVALPDWLCETTIWKFKKLCDSCGCHNRSELTAALAEESELLPQACPLALLLRSCSLLQIPVKLPACLSLG